jgi:general secretion pathway protein N
MKKWWPLLALGIAAFVLFALLTLPASVVLSRLSGFGIQASGIQGTLWNGSAQVLQVANANVGAVEWDLHLLPLFTARLEADIKVKRSDGFAETEIALSPAAVHFEALTASLPLSTLPAAAFPGGWTGTANLKFARLTLQNGWPVDAEGTLDVLNLTGPARRPANLGGYRVVFEDSANAAGALTGMLSDLGGPLQLTGKIELKPERSYLLDGLIATRPDAPRDIVNALQFLGEPDAQGRRPFSLSGTM